MGNLVAVRSEDGFLESQDQSEGVGIMTPISILISVKNANIARANGSIFLSGEETKNSHSKNVFASPFGPRRYRLTIDNSFWKLKNGTLRKTFCKK